MTFLEALRTTIESIKDWCENLFLKKGEATADDFGVYVRDTEPLEAVAGDIWVDTANDPTIVIVDHPEALPTVTTSDNGKVLMVVNGAWQVVDLNMAIDSNGVVSI